MHPALGGDEALARLRERLRDRGLKLMLDFVPNHTALDHPWVEDHPEYYVVGTELDLARAPQNYTWVKRPGGDRLLAYGRDPYFPGWPDTLQLNYGNPATQDAMLGELLRIAGQCDGVRCDMAMLVLPEVFERTWGIGVRALLAGGDPARAGAGPRLLLHGRGLLGPRMDAAAAGVRLHLRQAAVRPAPRAARRAGARALPRGPGLPGQAGPLPGEPRRAARRRDLPARRPRGRGRRSPTSARDCGSSRKVSPRAARNASPPTSAGSPTSPRTRAWGGSTTACSPSSDRPPSGTGAGNCWSARPRGTATRPTKDSSRSPGRARAGSGCVIAVNYARKSGPVLRHTPFRGPRREDLAAAGPSGPGDL